MESILTQEDKKVLRFVSRYLNSLGMEDGTLETEGFDEYDIPDLSKIDVESWSHFSNNYRADVPEKLYPILKKILTYVSEDFDSMDTDGVDFNYGRVDIDIDTKQQEISVNYWYSYYDRGEYNSDTLDVNDDENVAKVFEEILDAGIEETELELRYNGSGDSGYIENTFENGGSCPAAIEDFCYRWLENSYGGWEINEGSQGQFIFNVEEKTITLEHQMNYEETRTHTLFEESFAKI